VLSAVGSFGESERGKALPQFKQNPEVSSFAVPQFGQYILASTVLATLYRQVVPTLTTATSRLSEAVRAYRYAHTSPSPLRYTINSSNSVKSFNYQVNVKGRGLAIKGSSRNRGLFVRDRPVKSVPAKC